MNKLLFSIILLCTLSFAQINITLYHVESCTHCAATKSLFNELSGEYDLDIIQKEVYYNQTNKEELFSVYEDFGLTYTSLHVPTSLINNQALVIGELSKDKWKTIFGDCLDGNCTEGIYTNNGFTPKGSANNPQQLTLAVLIGAALVDSINPCTIAVMVMLLSSILLTKGKERALLSGIAFTITIFVMYLLMGFGFLQAITSTGLTGIFFLVTTAIALILSLMELNAYFNYKPGFCSVEMPLFLRPYTKAALTKATSLSGVVVAAMLCSLFLLPCSSGPYLMVLSMIAKSVTMESFSYLLLYNLIFVLPMLFIVIAVYKGMSTVEQMNEAKNKYIREIHLVSGILLFAMFLIMLNQLFNFI